MITKQHSFVIVPVLLGVWMDVVGGVMSIQLIPQHPVIQGSVTLSVSGITGTLQSFTWFKGPNSANIYQILAYFPGDKENPLDRGPLFHDRMTPHPNGSLQISNLNTTDGGNYIVKVQADKASDMYVYLKIYGKVGKPTITTSSPRPRENDVFTLTCNSTNAETIIWSRVPCGTSLPSAAILSPDNRTVSFSRISRSDSGDYQCQGSNPVSKENNDITITVAYGPENLKIDVRQSVSNSFISLECSADSIPAPTYQWRLNGTDIHVQQNPLHIDLRKAENEGTYTCLANNSVTQLTVTSSEYVPAIAPVEYQTVCLSGSGLGGGEIAAIVIGTVVGILILEVIVYFVLKAKRNPPRDSVYENAHVSEKHNYETTLPRLQEKTSQDSNYEELTYKNKSIYSTMESAARKH